MPKKLLLIIVLSVIIITSVMTLAFYSSGIKPPPKNEIEIAINQAGFLFRQRKAMGEDFSRGSCLTNALMPGWVVDIVHVPRLPIDDLPENQCAAYTEGKVNHFVELDLEGNFIRAR